MTTERLQMAIKNFENMNHMAERYTRLCRAYVKLSERFHQLDVEHMKLKGNLVPLLKAVKTYCQQTGELKQANLSLQQNLAQQESRHQATVQNLVATYEEQLESLRSQLEQLRLLEGLTTGEAQQELAEAEHQIELDEEIFREIDQDASPDLSNDEKALLVEYQADPAKFFEIANGKGLHSLDNGALNSSLTLEPPSLGLEIDQN